jgi:hypothetical protein
MNTASLLKRAPILIMIACLSYSCYTIHAILPDSSAGPSDLAKGLDILVEDAIHAGADEVKALTREALRDPFRIRPKPEEATKPVDVAAADPESDPLAGVVQGLSLDATFLQGKTQIAIINGRMYNQGQHLLLQADSGKTYSPLFVRNVQAQRVTLMAHNRTYELGYPDKLGARPAEARKASGASVDGSIAEIDPEGELAFYKKLMNSPLGKLGKSLTGDLGSPGRASPTAATAKSSRSRARGASAAP